MISYANETISQRSKKDKKKELLPFHNDGNSINLTSIYNY